MKEIKLTKGKVALVDDSDYEWLNKSKWYANEGNSTYYARRYCGVGTSIKMHQQIMTPPKGMLVDHRDGDGLNNQRSNLRICTISQNNTNRKPSKNGTSKYLGVSRNIVNNRGFSKANNCYVSSEYIYWKAQIIDNKKVKVLGNFKTELEAAIIYNLTARRYHGEYARPNKFNKQ